MGLQPKYSDLILNLLVALAVSLVVNFSYVLLLIVDQKSDGQPRPAKASVIARGEEGTLRVSPDGHGYIVYENGDSVYVMMQRIYRMNLKDGDRLVANLAAPRRHGAHPVMTELRMRNGEEFDYSTLFNRPSKTTELALQLFYYLVVSFIMLSILTSVRRRYTPGRFVRHCIWCVLAAAALYMVAPVTEWRSGRIMLNCMGDHIFDYIEIDEQHAIFEVQVPEAWIGKSVGELNVRRKFGINILGIKRAGETDVSVTPDTILSDDITILALGEYKALQKCFRI